MYYSFNELKRFKVIMNVIILYNIYIIFDRNDVCFVNLLLIINVWKKYCLYMLLSKIKNVILKIFLVSSKYRRDKFLMKNWCFWNMC